MRKLFLFMSICVLTLTFSTNAETITFRNGLLIGSQQYSGTYDGMTNQGDPNRIYGGSYWPLTIRATGAEMQDTVLVRFADLKNSLPNGFVVQSARVGLTAFYGVWANIDVKVSELAKPWDNAAMTWNIDGLGNNWAAGGALGIMANGSIPADRYARVIDSVLIIDGAVVPGDTVWFDMDPTIVQKWVYNENVNYGLVFYSDDGTNNTFSVIGRIGDGEYEVGRPQLEITGFVPTSCAEIWANGSGVPTDLNHDCYIDLADLVVMIESWLACNDPASGCF